MTTKTKRLQAIWCLYDWAHSVWPVIIITFVFPNYFTQQVAESPLQGSIYWGHALTISGILTALIAPLTGVIADTLKNSTLWFRAFTLINILCAYLTWFVMPDSSYVLFSISIIVLGTLMFELSSAFYNSYLTDIAEPKDISRISGIGWGLGYTAGIVCLGLCLTILVLPDKPLFGLLSTDQAQNVRATGIIVGTWYLLFAIPLLRVSFTSHNTSNVSFKTVIQMSYKQCISAFEKSKNTPYIYYYLIIRMIYTDGINTLFAFAGIYAASRFNMGFEDIMYFGIACNISAGIGCFISSWSDSIIGEQRTLQISLVCLSAVTSLLLLVDELHIFWVLALTATLFVGPLQSSSRSLMAKICPEESKGEYFGLYALSGRVTSFLGPMLLTYATQAFSSQTIGMATIILFLVIGAIGMIFLRIPQHLIMPTTSE